MKKTTKMEKRKKENKRKEKNEKTTTKKEKIIIKREREKNTPNQERKIISSDLQKKFRDDTGSPCSKVVQRMAERDHFISPETDDDHPRYRCAIYCELRNTFTRKPSRDN